MTNEQIFASFLKKHRKYTSFKKQVIHDTVSSDAELSNCICSGFSLSNSKEGADFWLMLDVKWEKLVEDFGLQGGIDLTKI